MSEDDPSKEVWEFLSTARGDRELVRKFQSRSVDSFFGDLQQLEPDEAKNVLLVMSGRMNEVPPAKYQEIHGKGWVFIPDYDLDHPDKYGVDENGMALTGCLVESPNFLMSVSLSQVAQFVNSQELYADFFRNVLGQ